MSVLRAVLFDLDETLIDWSAFSVDWRVKEARHIQNVLDFVSGQGFTLNATAAVVQDVFTKRVREAWSHARMTLRAPHIGVVLMATLTHFGLPDDALSMTDCLLAYGWGGLEGINPFPDVPPALSALRAAGIAVGIVTNSHQPALMRDLELRDYDLLQYFPDAALRICAADVGYLKPHPAIFRHALNALGTQADETVFVGDNIVADIGGAHKVGMKTVLRVNHGKKPLLSDLIKADAVVNDLGALLLVLDEWYEGWRVQAAHV